MYWQNLLKNKCPKCGKVLCTLEYQDHVNCSNKDCDFKISLSKFTTLTSKITMEELEETKKDQPNVSPAEQIENNNE